MSPKLLIAALMFVPLAATAWAAGAGSAPRIAETNIIAAQHPYDESADAGATIAAAQAKAKAVGKKLMIVFGANWCPDCRVLAGIADRPEVKPWLDANYVTVLIDTGRHNKNMDIAAQYGLALQAIPSVLVLTADGKVVNRDEALALGDARTMAPQDVVALLARWSGEAPATN